MKSRNCKREFNHTGNCGNNFIPFSQFANSFRCAGKNKVACLQRYFSCQLAHDFPRIPDHIITGSRLFDFSIHSQSQIEIRKISSITNRNDFRNRSATKKTSTLCLINQCGAIYFHCFLFHCLFPRIFKSELWKK